MTTREEFCTAAMSMEGTRYKHQGRSTQFALDCAGLVVCAAQACGHDIYDAGSYSHIPDGTLLDALERECVNVANGMTDVLPGDVLVFAWDLGPQHLAIYLGDNRMIHAHASVKRVAVQGIDETWMRQIYAVMRPKFLADEA